MAIHETKKFLARKLRKEGKSYSEIRAAVGVSKSTISLWLRDINLTKEQKERMNERWKFGLVASKKRQRERIRLTREIIEQSKSEANNLIDNKLFLCGLMLYWAEGTKSNELVNFSNSDPKMIKFMMRWFREVCKVPEDKFRIQVHAHPLHQKRNIIDYWKTVTDVSLKQFHKLIIKNTSLSHRKNVLYQGTCCIRINNVKLFRKIVGWKIGVLKNFGLKDNYKIPK